MSQRLPLTIGDGQLQALQRNDTLDPLRTGLVSACDFDRLHAQFRLLLLTLAEEGIPLPDPLLIELEHTPEDHHAC
jgi:hypothetical protein